MVMASGERDYSHDYKALRRYILSLYTPEIEENLTSYVSTGDLIL